MLDQVYGQDAEPAPDGDQWRLRTKHHAETEGGERRRDNPEELDGLYAATGLETLRGLVAAGSRQVADGQGDEDAAQCQPGQRPPQWLSLEPEALRERGEDLGLDSGHRVQEEIGHRGHRDAQEGSDQEERDVAPGLDDRGRVWGRRRLRRCGGVGHGQALGPFVGLWPASPALTELLVREVCRIIVKLAWTDVGCREYQGTRRVTRPSTSRRGPLR